MINEWFVIANPAAGGGRVKALWHRLENQLMSNLPIGEVVQTTHRGQATHLARQAVEEGYRQILAIGGDGTNHEVANGILVQQKVPSTSVRYALLPIGTGNDWAKTHRIPNDPSAAIAAVQRGKTVCQDVGKVRYKGEDGHTRERYFVNVAGLGYDAFVCQQASSLPPRQRTQMMYLSLAVKCLWQYDLRSAKIRIDGRPFSGKYYTINIGLGRYSGGGMQFVPQADPFDGQLAVAMAGELSKWQVIQAMPRLYGGNIEGYPKVILETGKEIEIVAGEVVPTLLEADGEYLGHTPALFTLKKSALTVIVP